MTADASCIYIKKPEAIAPPVSIGIYGIVISRYGDLLQQVPCRLRW